MASQVGHYHPKFEGGKVVSAVVMPPQAHRELQGKQNKTKQNTSGSTWAPVYIVPFFLILISQFAAASSAVVNLGPLLFN